MITRTKINNKTGVVQDGALFTEEYLPSETIMYSLALASNLMAQVNFDEADELTTAEGVMEFFTQTIPNTIQIGGNATIGKGIVSILIGESYAN